MQTKKFGDTALCMPKKEIILTTAIRLFTQNNYINVGVDEIIAESKVAKMTLYKHFSSKEKLILCCLQQLIQNIQFAILQQIHKHNEPHIQLQQIYLCYLDWVKSSYPQGCPIHKARIEISNIYPSTQILLNEYQYWLYQLIYSRLKQLYVNHPKTLTEMVIYTLSGSLGQEIPDTIQSDHRSSWTYLQKLIEIEKNF